MNHAVTGEMTPMQLRDLRESRAAAKRVEQEARAKAMAPQLRDRKIERQFRHADMQASFMRRKRAGVTGMMDAWRARQASPEYRQQLSEKIRQAMSLVPALGNFQRPVRRLDTGREYQSLKEAARQMRLEDPARKTTSRQIKMAAERKWKCCDTFWEFVDAPRLPKISRLQAVEVVETGTKYESLKDAHRSLRVSWATVWQAAKNPDRSFFSPALGRRVHLRKVPLMKGDTNGCQ